MQHVIVAEGLSLRCLNLLHEWACTFSPRLDKLGRSPFLNRTPGVSLRVREAQARAVRFAARTLLFSACLSKPSAFLGSIHCDNSFRRVERERRRSD